jgi:hypothetical protein
VACHAETSSVIDKLYESPEFVRFQMLAPSAYWRRMGATARR